MSNLIMFQVEQLHDMTSQKRISEEEFGTKPGLWKVHFFPVIWKHSSSRNNYWEDAIYLPLINVNTMPYYGIY